MGKQLYFEEVTERVEITPLVKFPTAKQLVKWAGASEDFYPIHYDKDFALAQGLPGVIVHGRLRGAFLIQMLTDWIGDAGALRKMSIRQRGMDYPEQYLGCKGKVTSKHVENDDHLVECEIWTENEKGEKTTSGTARVMLPSRG